MAPNFYPAIASTCIDDPRSTCPGTNYLCSCDTCYNCDPNGVACNCFNCGCYSKCCDLSTSDVATFGFKTGTSQWAESSSNVVISMALDSNIFKCSVQPTAKNTEYSCTRSESLIGAECGGINDQIFVANPTSDGVSVAKVFAKNGNGEVVFSQTVNLWLKINNNHNAAVTLSDGAVVKTRNHALHIDDSGCESISECSSSSPLGNVPSSLYDPFHLGVYFGTIIAIVNICLIFICVYRMVYGAKNKRTKKDYDLVDVESDAEPLKN